MAQYIILTTGQAIGYRERAITRWYIIDPSELTDSTWALPEHILTDMERMKDQQTPSKKR
jgi:hypothetical protein